MNAKEYFSKQHIVSITCLICMIIYMSIGLYNDDIFTILAWIGTIFLAFVSLLVTVIPRPGKPFTAGIIGFGFGILMLLRFVGLFQVFSIISYIIASVGMCIGMICIFMSFMAFCGDKYNARRMIIIIIIMMCTVIFSLLVEVGIYNKDFNTALDEYKYELLIIIPATMYIILLSDNEISVKGIKKRFVNNVKSISNVMIVDDDAYLIRDDIIRLNDEKSIEWKKSNEHYVEAVTTIPFFIDKKEAKIEIQKWKDGKYWMSIVKSDVGTIMQSMRFEIRDIVPDDDDINRCSSVTIYSSTGYFIRILIKDKDTKSLTKGQMFFYKLIGYDY